jgi:hypothetical protein
MRQCVVCCDKVLCVVTMRSVNKAGHMCVFVCRVCVCVVCCDNVLCVVTMCRVLLQCVSYEEEDACVSCVLAM